jgi:hypothetical protein
MRFVDVQSNVHAVHFQQITASIVRVAAHPIHQQLPEADFEVLQWRIFLHFLGILQRKTMKVHLPL